jgi:hypothetical protein
MLGNKNSSDLVSVQSSSRAKHSKAVSSASDRPVFCRQHALMARGVKFPRDRCPPPGRGVLADPHAGD